MNENTKKTAELTIEQIKAIKLDDEVLEKINGGMWDIPQSNRDSVSFSFGANELVYDTERNCTGYVVGMWPQQDTDGLWRAAYSIAGSYDSGYATWITWERCLEPANYIPAPIPGPAPAPSPKPRVFM